MQCHLSCEGLSLRQKITQKTQIAHPDVLQTSLLLPLEVVRLSLASLPRAAPEGELAGGVGGGDPLVPVSPEPAVHIDRLELSRVATFVEKIALPATGPHGGDVIWATTHTVNLQSGRRLPRIPLNMILAKCRYSSGVSNETKSMHLSRQKFLPLNQSQSSNLFHGSLQERK